VFKLNATNVNNTNIKYAQYIWTNIGIEVLQYCKPNFLILGISGNILIP